MTSIYFSATVYVKQQPQPYRGDEAWPDGCVGLTFKPMPSITLTELKHMISDLMALAESMERTHD